MAGLAENMSLKSLNAKLNQIILSIAVAGEYLVTDDFPEASGEQVDKQDQAESLREFQKMTILSR